MNKAEKKEPVKFGQKTEVPVLTGVLKFQFDDGLAKSIANVFDKKAVYISLQQGENDKVVFDGPNGEKLTLFIEEIK